MLFLVIGGIVIIVIFFVIFWDIRCSLSEISDELHTMNELKQLELGKKDRDN